MAVLRYFYTTPGLSKNVREALDDKVDKEEGMGLSQNDYTDTEKDKLEGVEDGAEVNVQADWNEIDTESDAYIQNKPSVPILDPSGQIPASYLPSYVDDVLEYPTYSQLPQPGETGKIYVTTDTDLAYRWSGSTYVEISKSIITGVKGNAETDYRIGNVNLTATNIGLGNVVNLDQSKAIKSITRSGTTFTYTCLDGTTGTFTQQDNNTTYSAGTGLSLSNTTFSLALTKKLVTDALGYTPPTTDTNTTYSAGTGLSLSSTTFSVKYGTAAGTACQGNDSRLSNSRPASDVYSWAKASSKPSYAWSEITGKPSTFTPASHTHDYLPLSGGTLTGGLQVNGRVFGYNYGTGGNNCAAFVFDKPGTNYTGIGAHKDSNIIWFGPCNSNGAWVDSYTSQCWKFWGQVTTAGNIVVDNGNKLQLNDGSGNGKIVLTGSNGNVWCVSVTQTSDIRYKNIVAQKVINISDIASAPLFQFLWKDESINKDIHIGTSAQYWKEVLPEVVVESPDENKQLAIEYSTLGVATSISIAKEVVKMQNKIDTLEQRIQQLEEQLSKLIK